MRLLLAILVAILGAVQLHAQNISRTYLDHVKVIDDSIVAVPLTESTRSAALELRFRTHGARQPVSLLWNMSDDMLRYDAVSVEGSADPKDPFASQPEVVVRYHRVDDGVDSSMVIAAVPQDYPLDVAWHTFSIEIEDNLCRVGFGRGVPEEVALINSGVMTPARMGVMAGGEADVALLVSEVMTDALPRRYRDIMDPEILDSISRKPPQPGSPEGVWKALDRDTDSRRALAGGRYRLLITENGDGFDIVYLGGAEVADDEWAPGMLRGRLTPTGFEGHYDLEWVDARHNLINSDAYCQMENDMIISLQFPLLKSVLRFTRE